MNKDMEEWRDIPNYEGYYQASNLGRVRSLDRTVICSDGRERFYKGRVIEGVLNKDGYRQASLYREGIGMSYNLSQLVSMAFLGHEPNGNKLVVDHINGDKLDNRDENLRIVTNRANLSTCFRSDRKTLSSKYAGVSWDKGSSKWKAQVKFKGDTIYLGLFIDEPKAFKVYQLALSKIKDGLFNPDDYKAKWTSKYKGVCFYKAKGKWVSRIRINGKQKHLGYFLTELEAYQAIVQAEKQEQVITP